MKKLLKTLLQHSKTVDEVDEETIMVSITRTQAEMATKDDKKKQKQMMNDTRSDVLCYECEEEMVMSDETYAKLKETGAKAACLSCFLTAIKK